MDFRSPASPTTGPLPPSPLPETDQIVFMDYRRPVWGVLHQRCPGPQPRMGLPSWTCESRSTATLGRPPTTGQFATALLSCRAGQCVAQRQGSEGAIQPRAGAGMHRSQFPLLFDRPFHSLHRPREIGERTQIFEASRSLAQTSRVEGIPLFRPDYVSEVALVVAERTDVFRSFP